ncbi:ATP-binding protein [Embleya sp. NPDC059259]|uniref:ATP-binding protein n=1 Tax=unclassified Embleya TaxID=2699296 RepID=UPI003687D112
MADMRAVGWARSSTIAGGVAGQGWTRQHLACLVWTRDAPERMDDVLPTVSEPVTNAHVRAHSDARLVLGWDSRCPNVHVSDTAPGLPAARADGGTLAPSGRVSGGGPSRNAAQG